jgi:hypothetical protein
MAETIPTAAPGKRHYALEGGAAGAAKDAPGMKTLLYIIGLCVVLLLIASSQSASARFCLGKQNGCLVFGSGGVHLVSNDQAAKFSDDATNP